MVACQYEAGGQLCHADQRSLGAHRVEDSGEGPGRCGSEFVDYYHLVHLSERLCSTSVHQRTDEALGQRSLAEWC